MTLKEMILDVAWRTYKKRKHRKKWKLIDAECSLE